MELIKSRSLTVFISLSVAAVVVVVAGTTCFKIYKQRKRSKPDGDANAQWRFVGRIGEVILYPMKSCSGLNLDEAFCDKYGLEKFGLRDRCLKVYSLADDAIAFAGQWPQMLSVKTELMSEELVCLIAPNASRLWLNHKKILENEEKVLVKQGKGFKLKLVECQPEHHVWISQVILNRDSGMRLYIACEPILETSWWRKIHSEFCPVMVMHDKSVKDLNQRLSEENQVHHQQFRGNLLVESVDGVQAFDEDNWQWMRIGENVENSTILKYNSPCLRCILPNVNIFTCERNKDFEPLRTLRRYRLGVHPRDPEMGIYFDIYQKGLIKLNDPVYVQYK